MYKIPWTFSPPHAFYFLCAESGNRALSTGDLLLILPRRSPVHPCILCSLGNKPRLILLGPDSVLPSHNQSTTSSINPRHFPQFPNFNVLRVTNGVWEITWFSFFWHREHKGVFILASLCSPQAALAQVMHKRVWSEWCPEASWALSAASVSSPSPSEGFSFLLWHPFSLNSSKL